MAGEIQNASAVEPIVGNPLGSDAPQAHPSFDEFGYAPFARAIARAARTTTSPKGLVMAIDGPWGAGKTSLLNFVQHYLSDPDTAAGNESALPVRVEFNPWWFADREQLAMQFLEQFRARFPAENKVLMSIGDAFAQYADAIGSAVATSVSAGTGAPIPLLGSSVSWLLKKFKRPPKDVPALKVEVSEALETAEQRFVVFVDDIDRLAPDEIREVFKVIKAVADFPNVVYILAFDRRLVSEALRTSLGIEDGDAYLEKIVQAQFVLPAVSDELLIQKLLRDLDRLIGTPGDEEIAVDSTHWSNVFHDGLSPLIQTPRDVVRVINALMVTFPAVRGEVNPVDFIALEFLRVFVPTAYAVIRNNKAKFTGLVPDRGERVEAQQFHDGWLETLAARHRAPVKALLKRLFPRLQWTWGNVTYGTDSLRLWSAQTRVCVSEKFDRFFQFGVSPDELSEQELRAFIGLGADVDALADAWIVAFDERRPSGPCKANDLITALTKLDDLPVPFAAACMEAFFRVGDRFLSDPRNSVPGFFSVHADLHAFWLINHLAKALPDDQRETTILRLIWEGEAIGLACRIAYSIDRMHQADAAQRDSAFQDLAPATVEQLRNFVIARLREIARGDGLIRLPDIYLALLAWSNWADIAEIQQWFQRAMDDDEVLMKLLVKSVRVGTSYTYGERITHRIASVDPKLFKPYLLPPADLEQLSARLRELASGRILDEAEAEAMREFEKGMDTIRNSPPQDNPAPVSMS
ncbi:KAP family P-loop NTPase fold protein [Caballeronia sordidicola]|nr:P-loop NTPase fold protein [Caballeronia sordidicola]